MAEPAMRTYLRTRDRVTRALYDLRPQIDEWLEQAEKGQPKMADLARIEGLNGTRNRLIEELHRAEQILIRSLRHRMQASETELSQSVEGPRAA